MNTYTIEVRPGFKYEVDAASESEALAMATQAYNDEAKALPPQSALERSREMGAPAPTSGMESQAQQAQGYDLGRDAQEISDRFAAGDLGWFAKQFGVNLGVLAEGAAQGVASVPAMVVDPTVAAWNSLFGDNAPTVAQGIEQVFQSLGVPPEQAQNELQKIGKVIASGAAGAGSVAGAAKTVAPMLTGTGQRVAQTMAAQPMAQTIGGGTAALGSEVAGDVAQEAGASPEVEAAARIAGGVVGGVPAAMIAPGGVPITGESARMLQDAERAGVKVMTSDVFRPKGPKANTQRLIEGNPFFGTGPMRAEQQAQRELAVRNLVKEYGADDAERVVDEVASDALKTRSDEIGKWYGAKMEVLKRLDDLGTPVKTPKAIEAIDAEIARMKKLGVKEGEAVISDLENWKKGLSGAEGAGQTLLDVEEIRGLVGNSYSAGDNLADATKKIGKKSANPVYQALKEDMADHIRKNGVAQDFTKWSVANKKLSTMIEDLEMSSFNRLLEKGEIEPEVVTGMLFSKSPSKAEMLFDGLSDKGKASARTAIIAKAYENASKSGNFAGALMSELEKMSVPVKTFFKGEDLARLKGLERIIEVTKRADVAMSNPPTGQTNLVPQMTLGIAGGPAAIALASGGAVDPLTGAFGAAALSGIGVASRIYESKPVRDILIKLGQVKKGGPEEAALLKKYATASAIVAATQARSDKKKENK